MNQFQLTLLLIIITTAPLLTLSQEITLIQAPLPEETSSNATGDNETINGTVASPTYTDDKCNVWLSLALSADTDSSNGLSEEEFYNFLTSISDPPFVSEYFDAYGDFKSLPWIFKVVHKTLACSCARLGLGEKCCEGNDAEVLLNGLDMNVPDEEKTFEELVYRDDVCQQMEHALERSVPVPSPTVGPTTGPTPDLTTGSTAGPTTVSTGKASATSPVTTNPTSSPPSEPSPGPTPPPPSQGITIRVIGSVIDYSKYDLAANSSTSREGLEPFIDAKDIMENFQDNGVLNDIIYGFDILAFEVVGRWDGAQEEGFKE